MEQERRSGNIRRGPCTGIQDPGARSQRLPTEIVRRSTKNDVILSPEENLPEIEKPEERGGNQTGMIKNSSGDCYIGKTP